MKSLIQCLGYYGYFWFCTNRSSFFFLDVTCEGSLQINWKLPQSWSVTSSRFRFKNNRRRGRFDLKWMKMIVAVLCVQSAVRASSFWVHRTCSWAREDVTHTHLLFFGAHTLLLVLMLVKYLPQDSSLIVTFLRQLVFWPVEMLNVHGVTLKRGACDFKEMFKRLNGAH